MDDGFEPAWRAQQRNVLPSSSKPMLGGLGRELRFRQALELLPPSERSEFTTAVFESTRPMTARELDEALLATGLTRADRKRLVAALKRFELIMVVDRA